MKDHRFIELVNLYIDRQITAEETAELEMEIQGNPERRALYRQYCQMHSATKQVYESFRDHASDQLGAQPTGRSKIINFESQVRHRRSRWTYYAGGLAAAACLAVVFVRLNSVPAPTSAASLMANLNSPPPAAVVAAVPRSPVPGGQARTVAQPAVGLLSLRNSAAESDYAALLATLRQEELRDFASGRIQSSRLPSLFEDGVFDTPQGLPVRNQRTYGKNQTPAQQAEFTAFQFQR